MSSIHVGPSTLRLPRNISLTSSTSPSARYKPHSADILFLGSGNFSLPAAFVLKRMAEIRATRGDLAAERFAQSVIATELETESNCLEDPETQKNVGILRELGVRIQFRVDGQHLQSFFPGQTFSRIQWDCPDVDTGFCDHRGKLAKTIKKTAQSAKAMLREGGTLHFTLITPHGPSTKLWQGTHYGITDVESEGFYLYEGRPRVSGSRRYSYRDERYQVTYSHKKTRGNTLVDAAQLDQMSEFIFVEGDQRTPKRFQAWNWSYQNDYSNRDHPRPVNEGFYSFYSQRPGPAESPTIDPNFDFEAYILQQKQVKASGQLAPKPQRDLSTPVDDFEMSLLDLEEEDLRGNQIRGRLRRLCQDLTKRL